MVFNYESHFFALYMKKISILFFAFLVLQSCKSIKQHNAEVIKPIPAKKLKKDVDFTYRKLKKFQPALYWYINKEQLDYKFDSLKTTITKPLTSYEFYTKLTPVINEIKQGHLSVFPNTIKRSKQEIETLVKKGIGPFSQFNFTIDNDRLFVEKNNSIESSIANGSEVISIDSVPVSQLLQKYKPLIVSDGYNKTFIKHQLLRRFPEFYTNEFGVKDSLLYEFKHKNTTSKVWIKRRRIEIENAIKTDSIKKKPSKTEKKELLAKHKKEILNNSIRGYDASTKRFNRTLSYAEKDSSIAILDIKSFSIGDYKTFYKQSFKEIKDKNIQYLIIDLRNNLGGRLNEINYLYSFIADSSISFIDKSVVATKTSLLKRDYFDKNWGINIVKGITYPLYASYTLLRVKKSEKTYFYKTSQNKPFPLNANHFKGKIYVLINGASFSASSIISSNLKGSKRAVFVGEETGGAYNGTVAGQMPFIKLPNSKIRVRLGLMKIAPHYKTDELGRGIHPDVEIIPTLEDKITKNDPERNWIFQDIKNSK